jgi:Putative peptidoglycan binding domain
MNMKRLIIMLFCLGFGMTPVLQAKDKEKKKHHKNREAAEHAGQANRGGGHQNRNVHANQPHAARQGHRGQHAQRGQAQQQRHNAVVREHNRAGHHNAQLPAGANRKAARIARENRARRHNYVVRNRNSYANARRHYHWRQYHERSWWRHHYNNFAFFAGGYYFWANGYWYPAYGYSPNYNNYIYNEPIYGYGGLTPGQVIVNVQSVLADLGYYYGAIDGLIGPLTRQALARYQANNGLIVTRAIDEPTLYSLGLT